MRRPRRLLLVGSATLAVAVLAAGCGGSDDDSPEAWASGFCSSVTTWADDVKTSVDSLKGGNLSKDSLSTAVDDVKASTETLESDLEDLGKPDTEAGQQAQESVNTLSSELSSGVDEIESAFDGVSAVSDVQAAAQSATATLSTMANEISLTFTTLQGLDGGDELKSAFQNSSDCQQLGDKLQQVTSSGS